MLRDHKHIVQQHKQKLKVLDQEAEHADRQARELSLVMCNLPYSDVVCREVSGADKAVETIWSDTFPLDKAFALTCNI